MWQEMCASPFIIIVMASANLCLAGEVSIGLRFRNFTNDNGGLADGTCCDSSHLSVPNCPPDQCDTSFSPCATRLGGLPCRAFPENPTPTMHDKDSFVLGSLMGNQKGNISLSTLIFTDFFDPGDIHFYILAEDNPHLFLIANFSFVIDWMDTFFSHDPNWRQMVLKNKQAELGIDVFYQCARYNFGPTCDTYCEPTHQYTCHNNGTKLCIAGWEGPDCDKPVPCSPGICHNGGSCLNTNQGSFSCICDIPYTGKFCESIPSTTTRLVTETVSTVPSSSFMPSTSSSPLKPRLTKKTPKTNASSSNDGVRTNIAIYVPVALGVLLLSNAAAACFFLVKKKKKRRSVGNKAKDPVLQNKDNQSLSTQAWSDEPIPEIRQPSTRTAAAAGVPVSLTTF